MKERHAKTLLILTMDPWSDSVQYTQTYLVFGPWCNRQSHSKMQLLKPPDLFFVSPATFRVLADAGQFPTTGIELGKLDATIR